MRYLTNQLGWRHDPFAHRSWSDHKGNQLGSHFCFGASHQWQSPTFELDLFAAEPFTIEMAKVWLGRDQFTSLINGSGSSAGWLALLSEQLELADLRAFEFPEEQKQNGFLLSDTDVILRVGFSSTAQVSGSSAHSQRFIEDLPEHELISLLSKEPHLLRFYLHFLRKFNPATAIHWDAGL
ncbi:MAG TPA: hypothetical protein PKD05_03660 [Candidatus Melainabacteria bacterium]|nr:hypothetical protein [Candidatus Melainabacteria bacterium]